jgi:hypothetical protein
MAFDGRQGVVPGGKGFTDLRWRGGTSAVELQDFEHQSPYLVVLVSAALVAADFIEMPAGFIYYSMRVGKSTI